MTDTFGKTLRRLRLDAQVGLRELARLVDKSPGYISDVEQDNVAPPSEEVIVRSPRRSGRTKMNSCRRQASWILSFPGMSRASRRPPIF